MNFDACVRISIVNHPFIVSNLHRMKSDSGIVALLGKQVKHSEYFCRG